MLYMYTCVCVCMCMLYSAYDSLHTCTSPYDLIFQVFCCFLRCRFTHICRFISCLLLKRFCIIIIIIRFSKLNVLKISNCECVGILRVEEVYLKF